MSSPAKIELRNYGNGHLALTAAGAPRIDLDPYLPRRRSRRDQALQALATDLVLLGRSDAQQDAIDVIDEKGALLAGPRDLVDRVGRELDMGDDAIALDDWERARAGAWRIVNVPVERGSGVSELVGTPADLFLRDADLFNRVLRRLPLVGEITENLPLAGQMATTGHSRALFSLSLEGAPAVTLAGDGLVGPADRDWIEDVAEAVGTDVLVAAVSGHRADALVWAVREWRPSRVVLYRDHDPYERSRPGWPMARFVEALEEDAPRVAVSQLRGGELVELSAPPAQG